jgi:hypothetical protein
VNCLSQVFIVGQRDQVREEAVMFCGASLELNLEGGVLFFLCVCGRYWGLNSGPTP